VNTPLPRSTWLRFRRTLTAGLFLVATVAGVNVGLQGAAVSPVALTVVAAPAPASDVPVADAPVPDVPAFDAAGAHHGHGGHR
jgi:hypothetical protein